MSKGFYLSLEKIQPSQLYISRKKLTIVKEKIQSKGQEALGCIPVKKIQNDIVYTDGHTRALVAYLAGEKELLVEWETETLDWEMYEICVEWCKKESIYAIKDLETRIIDHTSYEKLWYQRCQKMHEELKNHRKG